MADSVRVRIAPSPTGKFHLGTARTALFNFLFAKRHEGKFIVRIEDTDKERNSDEFVTDILEGLKWLGLAWDEGPEVGGPFEPYFEQERLHTYEQFIEQLLSEKKAYRCYCSKEELEAEKASQKQRGLAPRYSGRCQHLSAQEIDQFEREGRSAAVRFKVEPQEVVFEDLIRGKVSFDAANFGDFVIQRSDEMPLFVFSNVIDDHLMEISHVLRGEEHLSNTAKQLLLYQALKFLPPQFGHFPLIINADRSKMSKRKDPVSVTDDYKAKGYLPEAIINFLALLGWSSGTDREIFSLHELISEFQLERVGKSPSIFDPEKLLWMNGYYIRQAKIGDLGERAKAFIKNPEILKKIEQDGEYYLQAMALVQDRLKTLAEVEELIEFLFLKPNYEVKLLIAKGSSQEKTLELLRLAATVLEPLKVFTVDETEVALRHAAEEQKIKPGHLLWAVRAALSGKTASPGVFELLEVLGKTESLDRLKTAQRKLASVK